MKRLCRAIEHWIVKIVCTHVSVGGHCELCGKWVPGILVPTHWRITVCQKCQVMEPKEV